MCFAPTLSGRRPFRSSFQSTCRNHRERPMPLRSSSTNRRYKILRSVGWPGAHTMSPGWRWDMVHWELWMKAMQPLPVPHHARAAGQPAFLSKERADGRTRSRNVCFTFNRGQACNPRACAYTHSCSACGGSHPATRCNGRPQLPAREAAFYKAQR